MQTLEELDTQLTIAQKWDDLSLDDKLLSLAESQYERTRSGLDLRTMRRQFGKSEVDDAVIRLKNDGLIYTNDNYCDIIFVV